MLPRNLLLVAVSMSTFAASLVGRADTVVATPSPPEERKPNVTNKVDGTRGGCNEHGGVGCPPEARASENDRALQTVYCLNLKAEDYPSLREGFRCETTRQATFELFRKTASGKMVWKELGSGYLISDILDGSPNLTQPEAERLCSDPSSLEARGYLSAVSWRLPTGYPLIQTSEGWPRSEWRLLVERRIQEIAKYDHVGFWSAAIPSQNWTWVFYPDSAFQNGYSFPLDAKGISAVCIGK
jgi:hypothetical protein